MSGMPLEARFTNSPQGEVTDAARAELGTLLNQAYTAGELELADYQRLLDEAYSAKTNGELVPVAQALPAHMSAIEPKLGGDNPGVPGQLPPLNSMVEAKAAAKDVVRSQAGLIKVAAVGAVAVVLILLIILL